MLVCVHVRAVQNFKSIKSRGAIQQQMMNKLVDILEQYLREILGAQDMFERCKAAPPLTRNQPPVAGACDTRRRRRRRPVCAALRPVGPRCTCTCALTRLACGGPPCIAWPCLQAQSTGATSCSAA